MKIEKESVLNVLLDAFIRLKNNGELILAGQTVNTSIDNYELTQINNPSITKVEGECTIGNSVNFTGGGEFVFEKENEGQLSDSNYSFNGVATIKMIDMKLVAEIKDNKVLIKYNH